DARVRELQRPAAPRDDPPVPCAGGHRRRGQQSRDGHKRLDRYRVPTLDHKPDLIVGPGTDSASRPDILSRTLGGRAVGNRVEAAKAGLVLLAGRLRAFRIDPAEWTFIVAADGGARHALEQDVMPDHVIGDFDSLSPEDERRLLSAGVPFTRLPADK